MECQICAAEIAMFILAVGTLITAIATFIAVMVIRRRLLSLRKLGDIARLLGGALDKS